MLGQGGFGRVFLAHDEDLGRPVAIKVLRARTLTSPERVEDFLSEARLAASLRHSGIVQVLDIGAPESGSPFIVFEYIEGRTLTEVIKQDRPDLHRMVELLARVSAAIHRAHHAGLVHRDLKPSNILVDTHGDPYVTDFGLAVREDLQHLRSGEIAGSPPYMAPEQVLGETHRLDGRTDIWALGVVLYFSLRGRLPFSGESRWEVFDEILHRDPKPPRQVDDTVPRELERICLKCLSKRMGDRYETAEDLASDLRLWLVGPASPAIATSAPRFGDGVESIRTESHAARVVPKGLRAFDVEDADFFPFLLPGPRDREGLPESVRAWKRRLEEPDPTLTPPVALLYGPSGCGKSSLVKAGLLPRLAKQIRVVRVEATPEGTETALRAGLRHTVPELDPGSDLAEAAAALREGRSAPVGMKVLLVLDQFEQWLQCHPNPLDAELVRALRQCDGRRLQALVLVRDDFWMAITRFFRALEVPLVEGHNSASVELFDTTHARAVLKAIGRALGRFPADSSPLAAEADRFLDQAVAELAGPEGRIIPVRLCLFAEMLRHRPWVPATLRALGGIEGVGVTFLEETFSSASAPPAHRLHQQAAQAVLAALLPASTSDLKGHHRPAGALQEAAGYAGRGEDFADLMRILDNELRMVTPVDPGVAGQIHYQLTHDYLVPALRQWLTRKQRETRRGRAELRLATITALWRDRPHSRRLPSLWEWFDIRWHTRARLCSPDEVRMMRAAARHYLLRAGGALVVLVLGLLALQVVRERVRSGNLLQQALQADVRNLSALFDQIDSHLPALRGRLVGMEKATAVSEHHRDVALLLLYRDRPTPDRAARLTTRAMTFEPETLATLLEVLARHPEYVDREGLRRTVQSAEGEPSARLRAACVLVALGDDRSTNWVPAAPALARAVLAEERRDFARWLELLEPIASAALLPPLQRICDDPAGEPATQAAAAEILAEILIRRQDGTGLANAAVQTSPIAAAVVRRELVRREPSEQAMSTLRQVLAAKAGPDDDEAAKDRLAYRQAGAAVTLAAAGESNGLWPLLRHRDDPRLRSLLIQDLARSAILPSRLLSDRLGLPGLDPAECQAILLALAEALQAGRTPLAETEAIATARRLLREDPDPGVHSAAQLFLTRSGPARPSVLTVVESSLPLRRQDPGRHWEAGPNGHTLAVLPGPLEFCMGSCQEEPDNEPPTPPQHRRIDRSIAVATTAVTIAQFRAFRPSYREDPRYATPPDCPAIGINWYDAAAYCNWLSQQAGLHDSSQWCYPETIGPDMAVPAGAADRPGFRLPTEAEREFFCRAGTATSRPFGYSDALLPRYAWTWLSAENHTWPVARLLPNEFGLFDVLGNVWEWCHDGQPNNDGDPYPPYPSGTRDDPAHDADPGRPDIHDATRRILRGGAFDYAPGWARSTARYNMTVSRGDPYQGFRVVRTVQPLDQKKSLLNRSRENR
jgi:serine/threonine protein kinase/formylglycine-generating enzyme required for sulfatase activity